MAKKYKDFVKKEANLDNTIKTAGNGINAAFYTITPDRICIASAGQTFALSVSFATATAVDKFIIGAAVQFNKYKDSRKARLKHLKGQRNKGESYNKASFFAPSVIK